MRRFIVLLTAVILSATFNTVRAASWKMDKNHSQVKFSVAHLVISEVTGVFHDFDVTLTADKPDFSDAKVEATIKTSSIDTGNPNRDKHLRSDDFLNADKFPEIRFKSTGIEKTADDEYKIRGDLTIRDSTRSVVLDTKFKGTINGMGGTVTSAFKATTTIDRFAYGVHWDRMTEAGGLVAGKDVEITLLMEFTQAK